MANALSPAQVVGVDIDEANRIAAVTVPERMLSLAIGREGQNARLAAKLTGWRIDIRSENGPEATEGENTAAPQVVAEPEPEPEPQPGPQPEVETEPKVEPVHDEAAVEGAEVQP